MALSVQHGLKLHQVDVTTAFLNGNLEEEVYTMQPKGFVVEGEEQIRHQGHGKATLLPGNDHGTR